MWSGNGIDGSRTTDKGKSGINSIAIASLCFLAIERTAKKPISRENAGSRAFRYPF
jgi:hypothetical protein